MQANLRRFLVKSGKQPEFEEIYGAGGVWAALFHESKQYHGSVLLRSHEQSRAYTLIDFWATRAVFEEFKRKHAAAYGAIAHEGEGLTEQEEHLGWFEDLEA